MREIAYAQKIDNVLKLFLFSKPEPIEQTHPFEALMMSRLDFDIKVTEVPPVAESDMGNLLTYKLRSLYPGDPETTVFDYKVLNRNKQRYAVIFISSKNTIEEYKAIADKRPLILPFPVIHSIAQKQNDKDSIVLYWQRGWVDISVYEKGIFRFSSAIKREKEAFLDFLKIRNIIPKNFKEYKTTFVCFSDELEFLTEQSKEFFKETEGIEFITIEETLSILFRKSDYLFSKKKKTSLLGSLRIDMLAFAVVFLCCLLFNKSVQDRYTYLTKLRTLITTELGDPQKTAQYKQKLADFAKTVEKKPADMFILLYEVSHVFKGDVKILSIHVESKQETKGNNKTEKILFTIEGRFLSDPLKYVESFIKNNYFTEVSIVKQDTAKRVFTLSGVFIKGGTEHGAK